MLPKSAAKNLPAKPPPAAAKGKQSSAPPKLKPGAGKKLKGLSG